MNPTEALALIVVFGSIGATVVFLTRWITAHRVEMKRLEIQQSQPDQSEEVDVLRADLESLRAQLAEVQERLDFTERLLAQARERDMLNRGA